MHFVFLWFPFVLQDPVSVSEIKRVSELVSGLVSGLVLVCELVSGLVSGLPQRRPDSAGLGSARLRHLGAHMALPTLELG